MASNQPWLLLIGQQPALLEQSLLPLTAPGAALSLQEELHSLLLLQPLTAPGAAFSLQEAAQSLLVLQPLTAPGAASPVAGQVEPLQ